jgi:uncharacterized membrane protein YuzA (DUF378 family)
LNLGYLKFWVNKVDTMDKDTFEYVKKKAYMVAMVLLIVGGINWFLVGALNVNVVQAILGKNFVSRGIFVLVGIAALVIAFDRDTYLPFLGETIMPCSAIQERTPPGATVSMQVQVEPNAKVLYWAAEPETERLESVNDWRKAYLSYENAGVVKADSSGIATLKVRKPQPYLVPWKGRLEPHIHFRICGERGFLSRVKTVFLNDGHVEGFMN